VYLVICTAYFLQITGTYKFVILTINYIEISYKIQKYEFTKQQLTCEIISGTLGVGEGSAAPRL
jgi:hypothetical protein